VVLELGGNAGVIISESANLSKAIPRCVMGSFSYSGQVCIHAQRFFVHSSHFHAFCEMIKTEAEQLTWGNPELDSTEFSAMIDSANTKRVGQWVQEALEAGATLVSGGFERDGIYAPTILTNVNTSMRVCSEEVFGPVITIEPFNHFEKAVAMLNDSRFGLQAGVYTDSITEMDFAFQHIECGGVIINDVPTFRADHMPYGGVKDSGLGREGVKYAMLDMLEPKVMVK
jgi:acyl-CoA reductase-like NAD-dependent aldehyde dehydrogenase